MTPQVCVNRETWWRFCCGVCAVGLVIAACAVAYGDKNNKYVDECWKKLRAESKSIRYVMKGTVFVAKGAFSEDADAEAAPAKDVRAPLEATWLVSFEKLSMRRTQRMPIFQAGEPFYHLRSTTDVYTPQGRRTLVPADENQLNAAEPEFYINRRAAIVEAWDNPVLLAHGYFGTSRHDGNTFKSMVAPITAAGFEDRGEVTEKGGRVLRVFHSRPSGNGQLQFLEDNLTFEVYCLDPRIGHRVVRKRLWLRGRVRTEMSLSYDKTNKGVYYLSHSQMTRFDIDSEQDKLMEKVSLKTSSFEMDASGSFDLQPAVGMLIMDEATMTERRQK